MFIDVASKARAHARMALSVSALVTGAWLATSAQAQPSGQSQDDRGSGGRQTRMLRGPGGQAGPGGDGMRAMRRGGGGESMSEPGISSKDLEKYSGTLELTPDQAEAAEMLLEAMHAEFAAVAKQNRAEMEAIREQFSADRDPSVFTEKMPKLMNEMREKRTTLETNFLGDLRTLLSDSQAERWPSFERMRRRDTTVRRGTLQGESADLMALVDALPVDASSKAAAKPFLEQYELDLDRALVARNDLMEKTQEMLPRGGFGMQSMREAIGSEEFQKIREQMREARLRVRDTNRRYARQIEAALPPEAASKFEAEFRDASYPQVYRDTFAETSMNAADQFDDLTPEQRSELVAMRDRMQTELATANSQLASALDKADESGDSGFFFGGRGVQVGVEERDGATEDPVALARASRQEVEQKYLANLQKLLTDGQRDRLPKPRERGRTRSITTPDGRTVELDIGDEEGGAAVFVQRVEVTDDGGGPVEQADAQVIILHKDGEGGEEVFEFHSDGTEEGTGSSVTRERAPKDAKQKKSETEKKPK